MGFDLVGPDLVFGGLTALYVTSGIISIRDGAAGFANTGVLTVLVLYLVAEGVSQTGGKGWAAQHCSASLLLGVCFVLAAG